MHVLILAAGYATRLYPLTQNFPKPLLEVGGKAILDWLIEDLEQTDRVEGYTVVTNHKFAPHFQEWAEKIAVVDDGTTDNAGRLGAVRDMQLAIVERHLQQTTLLVLAGDNLLNFSLQSFLDYAKEKNTSCIMRYYEPVAERLLKCGVVTIDEDDLVTEMTEKSSSPATHWCCPPFYIFRREDLPFIQEGIESGCAVDAPGSFVAWLCHRAPVHAMEMPGERYDIGNLESYHQAVEKYGKDLFRQ